MVTPALHRCLCSIGKQLVTAEHSRLFDQALLVDTRLEEDKTTNSGAPGRGWIRRLRRVAGPELASRNLDRFAICQRWTRNSGRPAAFRRRHGSCETGNFVRRRQWLLAVVVLFHRSLAGG